MKILGLLLQSKKGEPLIISTSPSVLNRKIILYSNVIYENILETYRRREKIQRCILLQPNLTCVVNITKDYILYIYVSKWELSIAFDAIRKVTDFFNNTNASKLFLGANTGLAKLQVISKKFVQFMSAFEEFLYTRQLPARQYMLLNPQKQSKKKTIEFQIFNKFSHLTQQNDKKLILQMGITSSKLASLEVKKIMKNIENLKKFSVKSQDELDLLQGDPQKQNYITNYRKNLINFAYCGKKKNLNSIIGKSYSQGRTSFNGFVIQEQILQESMIQREKIKTKLIEKLQLHLCNGKIKQVLQFGQILVQGTQPQTAIINLLQPTLYWGNPKLLNKRLSPNSIAVKQLSSNKYQFTTVQNYKSKPIIDYIIRKQSFNEQKIPLLFMYSKQISSSNIQFVLKYKINQKWKTNLFDVEICVHLNPKFIAIDCKTHPQAYSLRSNKILWKAKQISHQSNSKGKIVLAFGQSNVPPNQIIKQIRLNMKSHTNLLKGLQIECLQDDGQKSNSQKTLIIEYKVQPNEEKTKEKEK